MNRFKISIILVLLALLAGVALGGTSGTFAETNGAELVIDANVITADSNDQASAVGAERGSKLGAMLIIVFVLFICVIAFLTWKK